MVETMKAIETVYRGINFRSRNEARWAVFMDQLGIPFEYEPEGFELNGLRYLPDFYLTDQKIWAEVKSQLPNETEKEKAVRLVNESGLALVFLIFSHGRAESIEHSGGPFYPPSSKDRHPQLAVWQNCIGCKAFSVGPYAPAAGFECWNCGLKLTSEQVLELADKGQEVFDETILADAFTVARQARFEFGETPHGLPPVDREGV